MTWPFHTLRPLSYGRMIADPAWLFENFSAKGEKKNPVAHYRCMSIDDIKALPVGHLAAKDCALWLWCTWPMIESGLAAMKAWGFTYKTGGSWAKQSPTGTKWAFGSGYIFRSADEPFLLGTIGAPPIRSHSERNLIVAPRQEHSRKPDFADLPLGSAHAVMERLFDGPGCELFARRHRAGWECSGDQLEAA